MAKLRSTCTVCGGDGVSWRSGLTGNVCGSCEGTGFIYGPTVESLDEMNVKLDSIITEQASQRIDLAGILTQIWNKVKDL